MLLLQFLGIFAGKIVAIYAVWDWSRTWAHVLDITHIESLDMDLVTGN